MGVTWSTASTKAMSGWSLRSASITAREASATSSSPAPRERNTSKATTGRPSISAIERGSATVSATFATWSTRRRRPSLNDTCRRAMSCAASTVATVRTDCSVPPTSTRPPEASCCSSRSCCERSAAVVLKASRRTGSSSTRTSRSTPPTRDTAPTPGTASSFLLTWLSTNHDSASSSRVAEDTV